MQNLTHILTLVQELMINAINVINIINEINVINDLNGKEVVGTFYKKELQKTNQKEFRIEKVIKKKGDKLYV